MGVRDGQVVPCHVTDKKKKEKTLRLYSIFAAGGKIHRNVGMKSGDCKVSTFVKFSGFPNECGKNSNIYSENIHTLPCLPVS